MAEGDSQRRIAGSPDAVVAWQHRDFRFYQAARFLGVMGSEAQAVGVAWQVYQLTHSPLALGYTGLALFVPGLVFTLPAGHLADKLDRRSIVMSCYALQAVATALLLWISFHPVVSIWPVYGVLFIIGTGRCFSGPAMASLLPKLVPREHFVNAVTWGATIFQASNAIGPMVGGFLFTVPLLTWFGGRLGKLNGAPVVYCFTLVCLVAYIFLMGATTPQGIADDSKKAFTLSTMSEGLRYVMSTRLLLGSISLDLFAVLLGGAVSLMPIFAAEVLHAGTRGLGILRAGPSMGALVVSLTLAFSPIKRKAGSTMLVCVAIFGAATVLFGVSRSLWLSCVALFFVGASDMVSVVVRSTILQLATPDSMRGRVSSINWLFLGASNELGEFESGLTAHWFGAVRAVIYGGIASLTVTGLWSIFFPALRRVDKLETEDLIAAEREAMNENSAGGAERLE